MTSGPQPSETPPHPLRLATDNSSTAATATQHQNIALEQQQHNHSSSNMAAGIMMESLPIDLSRASDPGLSAYNSNSARVYLEPAPQLFAKPCTPFSNHNQLSRQQSCQSNSSSGTGDCNASGTHLLPSVQQQQQQRNSIGSLFTAGATQDGNAGTAPAAAAAAAAAEGDGNNSGSSDADVPQLARQLGVSADALVRLFKAEAVAEYDQPVWMVVNLQGKIKGSYTCDKMLEFCKRGTLSAAQLVLGIDKNLPYVARQELSFYRTLGQLLTSVHAGARYTPFSEEIFAKIQQQQISAADWTPLIKSDRTTTDHDLTSDLSGLNIEGQTKQIMGVGSGSSSSSVGGGSSAAAAARLRAALQRLCGVGSQGLRGSGGKQPLWLYINHLGWCRGPFSGGKVMHAHLCGRLPRNTLVAAYDPEVPACMISGDVAQWFRPLGALLNNVANGWSYNPIKWDDLMQQNNAAQTKWQPLVYLASGPPPQLADLDQLQPPANITAAAGGGSGSGSGSSSRPAPAGVGSEMMTARHVPADTNAAAAAAAAGAAPLVLVSPQQLWQQQQQQQRVLMQPQQQEAAFAGYNAVNSDPGMVGAPQHSTLPGQAQTLLMQQQQQQRPMAATCTSSGIALIPWESGSFMTSSGSNATANSFTHSGAYGGMTTGSSSSGSLALARSLSQSMDQFGPACGINRQGSTAAAMQAVLLDPMSRGSSTTAAVQAGGAVYSGGSGVPMQSTSGSVPWGWQQQQQQQQQQQNELLYQALLIQQQQQQQQHFDASTQMLMGPGAAAATHPWQQQQQQPLVYGSSGMGQYLSGNNMAAAGMPLPGLSPTANSPVNIRTSYSTADSYSTASLTPAGGSPQMQELAAAGGNALLLLQHQQQQQQQRMLMDAVARSNSGGLGGTYTSP